MFGSVFLPWYGIGPPLGINRLLVAPLSAWEVFELTPVALTVAVAIAVARRSTSAAASAIALVVYALLSTEDIHLRRLVGARRRCAPHGGLPARRPEAHAGPGLRGFAGGGQENLPQRKEILATPR